jgi:peptidoglycan/LPS O-acetylase OafA/YrhL
MSLNNCKTSGEFLFKRFLRLYPTYWFSLTLSILVLFLFPIPGFQFSLKEIFFNYTMFQGVFKIRNVDGSYWSLIPELFFYVQIAILYRFKLFSKINYIVYLWLFLIIMSSFRPSILDIIFNFRFGMFFIAGIMFYKIKFTKVGFVEHGAILLSLLSVYIVRKDIEYLLISTLIFIIFYLFTYNKLRVLNIKLFAFLGFISYPLYLVHQSIGYVIIYNLKKNGFNDFLAIFVAISITIFISWIISKYVEKYLITKLKLFIQKCI